MHMDNLFSEMAWKPLTEIIRSRDLHTLHSVITKKQDGLIVIFPLFFFPLNVFFTSREMHSSSVSTTINQHL